MHCKTRGNWPFSGLFFDFRVILTSEGSLPEDHQKSGLFWASPFTMHPICTVQTNIYFVKSFYCSHLGAMVRGVLGHDLVVRMVIFVLCFPSWIHLFLIYDDTCSHGRSLHSNNCLHLNSWLYTSALHASPQAFGPSPEAIKESTAELQSKQHGSWQPPSLPTALHDCDISIPRSKCMNICMRLLYQALTVEVCLRFGCFTYGGGTVGKRNQIQFSGRWEP